jgi:hypothetical protein
VQFDTRAPQILIAATRLTMVTLPVTLKAYLRAADLPRLRACGPLGELLARQGQAHGEDHAVAELGHTHAGLPDDLLTSSTTPIACAVAVGWPGGLHRDLAGGRGGGPASREAFSPTTASVA